MLKAEKNYQFRERMRALHGDQRDAAVKAAADELAIETGWQVVLPPNHGEVVLTAAQDFQDYAFVAMHVSLLLVTEPVDARTIMLTVDPAQSEDYVITVGENVAISGKNERGLAQALYCLENRMSTKHAPFLKKEAIRHTYLFSPRMVHSGYALDDYPNEHLAAIAHAGMDTILVFVKSVNQTPSGFLDFNDLISRAARYGLDVYAYSYMRSEKSPYGEEGEAYYDSLYGELFKACPGFKGLVLVGESVGFPSKDPKVAPVNSFYGADGIPYTKPRPGFWPCEDYPVWLNAVKKAVYQHNPEADIVFWTYNWGYVDREERVRLIQSLPTDISLMVTFEMFESYKMDGFVQTVADYSIAFEGPGEYFLSEAKAAKERGIRLYTQANTGGMTWDIGTIPYEPFPYQWMRRYAAMREMHDKYGLCGVMESHHYGLFPSLVSDLTKRCFIAETGSMEDELREIVAARFGAYCVETVCEALEQWSEAIRCYTPTDADQYGAFRVGPSYPLCLIRAVKPPEPFPYQWMRRYAAMREMHDKYGLCGVMESHHYGLFPSLVSDLTKRCFIAETGSMEDELREIVAARFGAYCVETVCEALEQWSEAIRCYTPTDADQYGAFRVGPSYPLCLIRAVKPPTVPHAHFGNKILDVHYPSDYSPVFGLPSGRGEWPVLRAPGEIRSLQKMKQYIDTGVELLKTIGNANEELEYLINLGEYISCHVQTGIHAKQWFLAKSKAASADTPAQVRENLEMLRSIAKAERANAERAIPFVERDSRLGWEPSMEYITDAEHIRWKLRHLDYVEEFEFECYEKSIADKWFE